MTNHFYAQFAKGDTMKQTTSASSKELASPPLLTGRQANVMDHALAYPKLSRNGFEATNGTQNDDTWRELVDLGHAVKVEDFATPGKTKYTVTGSGIATLEAFHQVKNDVEPLGSPRL